jgi:hypothetical protein
LISCDQHQSTNAPHSRSENRIPEEHPARSQTELTK